MKYIKKRIGINEQKINFDSHRKSLLKHIQDIIDGGDGLKMTPPFYTLLTFGTESEHIRNLGYTREDFIKWAKYFSESPFYTNSSWSQVTIGEKYPRKSKNTLNHYFTISKTRENINNFTQNLYKLGKIFSDFSHENKTKISFKTLSDLPTFIRHNDNLKVFYYDIKYKQDIKNIVNNWAIENNISFDNRKYSEGFDTTNKSFGILMSEYIDESTKKIIRKDLNNGRVHKAEDYLNFIEKNIDIIFERGIKYINRMYNS